jgi:hypothetical protein
VLPFSKRPPPPDEYLQQEPYSVRTPAPGSYAPASYAQPSYVPPAPVSYSQQPQHSPAPAFVRQAAPTPYGYTQNQQQHYGRNDLSAPPPPHSLAPMAMSADSTGRQFSTTGMSQSRSHASSMMSSREKPSLKWGIMIALSGALLGGVLGLGMDARRQSARAAAAAEAKDAAPPAMVATALPVAQPAPIAQPVVAAPVQAPVAVAPPVVVPAAAVIPPPPVVLAAAPALVVPKAPVHARAAVRPHGFLAAKVTPPQRPAPEPKAEAPEPKSTKGADARAETPKAPPAKKDANTSDAMKILEAANKDTTNTL